MLTLILRSFPARPLRVALLLAALAAPALAQVQVPVAPHEWKPVRIGTGGLVTGMVLHPADATIRYARTDVGNAYRWSETDQLWLPLLVYNHGTAGGVPPEWGAFFSETGVESVQIDPSNPDIVFVAARVKRSNDLDKTHPARPAGILLKSTDRGRSFIATGATFPLTPNANAKSFGERIAVDPANSAIVYFGTPLSGLQLSLDGGLTWNLVGGGLPSAANVINITYDPTGGTTIVSGQLRTAVLYATAYDSAVYRSADGGQTWADITTGITVSGQSIAGRTRMTEIDSLGRLYVTRSGSNQYWRYAGSTWSIVTNPNTAKSLAIDPANPLRLFALSDGSAFSRSLDGGATWTQLRSPAGWLKFAPGESPFSWLPQSYDSFRSNGGIHLDRDGRLWIPQGNEGILTCLPSDTHTAATFPGWSLRGQGIEELVAHEVIIPPGSGDKPILTVHDAAAFLIDDPDQFTARQIPGQRGLISNGLGIACAPDDSTFIAFSAGDVNRVNSGPERGANYSAYSTDAGRTWANFPATQYLPPTKTEPETIVAGQIAVGRRTHLPPGQERIVVLPSNDRPPVYSHDRGATWQTSTGVPVTSMGTVVGRSMWDFSLRARLLIADPFINDRFYYITLLNAAYRSDDGGQTWIDQNTTGLPVNRHHSQLEANRILPGDFWFVSGYEGTTTTTGVPRPFGLFRSTDHIATFTRNPAVEFASCLALGKGRGGPGDEPFTVYILGKLIGVPDWGVFYSADAGQTWSRFAYNPAGLFDRPSMMAASWDTFGLLYLGFGGNTYVYGRALPATIPAITSTPADQALAFGQSTTLSASATGSPAPLYQWQRQPAGSTTWTDIPGATAASCEATLTPENIGTLYRLRAFNSAGSVTTTPVTLTPPLAVTVTASTGPAPHTPAFTVNATGALLAPVGDSATGGTATALGFTSDSFLPAHAFDRNPATGWHHVNGNTGKASWLQYSYATDIRHTVREYSLTTPNDWPLRNPSTWALLGSNNGTTWTTLDERSDQTLASNQTVTYRIDSPAPAAYAHYRLRIDSVKDPGGASGPQLAELRLIDNVTLRSPAYLWDFGHGQTSTAAAPAFTFSEPGTYSVTLTYTDSYRSIQVPFTVVVSSPVPPRLTFQAAPTVSSTGLAHVNNPIDLALADIPAASTTPLPLYRQTINNNAISGTLARPVLATGTLLSAADFNTLLSAAQTAAVTSGAIPFNLATATGTNDAASFAGTNATGTLVATADTSLATAFQQREFTTSGDVVGTGQTNSVGTHGHDHLLSASPVTWATRTGYLNLNQTTLAFGTPLSAVGFTQLHRDGTRTYTWTVNLIDLAAPSSPPVAVTLGTLAFTGLSVGATTGGPAAPNYRYDTFVGYLAPAGYAITSLRWSGGSFGNIDGLAYVAHTPAPLALTYATWLAGHDLPSATAFTADTDGDGLPDGLEFLLGTDPASPSQSHSDLTPAANGFTFTHPVNESATLGATLHYEWSTDLSTWHLSGETNPAGTTATLTSSAPAAGQVTVTLTVTSGPRARLFARLVATPSP
jgi:PKD repeat protein